jgi:mannitol/fructose-specific phosphotransferase system IIA component (Ntr-type)
MPATIDLSELFHADDVHVRFRADSVIDAIPVLLRPALTRRIHDRDSVERIVEAAIKREEETSTRCGSLYLPHARSASLDDFILALGANTDGVLRGQPEPRLIVAFASPEGRREQHLQLLATLARLSQNAAVVEKIADASGGEEVLQILRTAL